MSQEIWGAVDQYIETTLGLRDDAVDRAIAASVEAGLPQIHVSAAQGKLLNLIAQMISASTILEVGTLAGYSTIWLARALTETGRLVTLELDPKHAEVARGNIAEAGLGPRVEVRVGPAAESMRAMIAAKEGPFDLVFIDADKSSIPTYLELSLELTRPGSVIVVDNVVRGGSLAEANSNDENVVGTRRLHEMIADNPRLEGTTIQTVGAKGYDGLTLIVVAS
ncbi:MAG: O-methyltransferase [Fimbriimonadaceae bacterium]